MSVIVFLRIEIPYIEEMHRLDKDKQICPPGSDCQSSVFLSGDDKDNEHKTYLKGRKRTRTWIGPRIPRTRTIRRNTNPILELLPYMYHHLL